MKLIETIWPREGPQSIDEMRQVATELPASAAHLIASLSQPETTNSPNSP